MTIVNENAVIRLFSEEFNGRKPDPAGLTYWTALLDSGAITQTELRKQLFDSPEGIANLRRKVREQYQSTLNREADAAGVDFWVQEIRKGNVPNDMKKLGETFLTFETPSTKPPDTTAPPVNEPAKGIPDADPVPKADRFIKTEMKSWLAKYGMTEEVDSFLDEWHNQEWGDEETDLRMRETGFWKQRFPGMEGRTIPMSAAEYVDYEDKAFGILRSAGLPSGFYDGPEDVADWIRSGRSLTQLNNQIEEGYVRLQQTPGVVKDAFARMQGIDNSEGALLAFLLDPDRAQPLIEKAVAAAEVSGSGSLFGVNVGDERALLLAERGFNLQNTQQTFQQLRDSAALFNESITENVDLTIDEQGVNAAFGIDNSAETLRRRAAARTGALSGGGGLSLTQGGVGGRAGQ